MSSAVSMIRRILTLRYSTRKAISPNQDHLALNVEEIAKISGKGLYVRGQ